MSKRYYFDYNATSPLSNKVIDFIRSGDFLFGNPSSLHQSGKKARKFISETSDYLFKIFSLRPEDFYLIYNSGATEGINAFFKGVALEQFKEKKRASFFFSSVDHSAVVELKDSLELFGHSVYFFSPDRDGNLNTAQLINEIQQESAKGQSVFVNFTYISNETGALWPLEQAVEIKEKTLAIIHVDSVQLIGKKKDWEILSEKLDAYTFSGHKFGALKGVGFSFVKKNIRLLPLLDGGAQQGGFRPGTENALGVYSLKLAMEELRERFNPDKVIAAKKLIETRILERLGGAGEVIAQKCHNRNNNTIFIVIYGQKADILSAQFDMQGIEVSTGSACSSGISKENRVLLNMGFSSNDARSTLRFSFSPFLTLEQAEEFNLKIEEVLNKILKK